MNEDTLEATHMEATRMGATPVEDAPERPVKRLMLIGFAVTLVGLWGGVVQYIAPEIGLAPSGSRAWQWTWAHSALGLLPGAAAVAGGLIIMIGSRPSAFGHRLGGLTATLAGAWFVLGGHVWPVFYGGSYVPYNAGGSALMQLGMVAGYGVGVGVVLCALGGMAMTMSAVHRRAIPLGMTRETRRPAVTTIHEPAGV